MFRVLLSLAVINLVLFRFNYFRSEPERPYYLIDPPNYTYINRDYHSQPSYERICDPYNFSALQYTANIGGETYPKILPIYQNVTINFNCLDSLLHKKIILLWNKFTGLPLNGIDNKSINALADSKCPVTNCLITFDRSMLDKTDLVVFHMRSRIDEFPKYRFGNQRWMYLVYESQQHCPMCANPNLNGVFNLTATYKTDSDITNIYLMDSRFKWAYNTDFNLKRYDFKFKTGFSVILISNCDARSKRLEYIYELKKYIPVDIYGNCSKLKCPNEFKCREYLGNKYKFFFAFENSICNDYITEKFFETIKYDIVPVVLGGGDYSRYIPKSGFINALNYSSPKDLANQLIEISKNQTAYNEFFKWKQHIIEDNQAPSNSYLCEMCIRLQLEHFTGVTHKVINNLTSLMGMNESCIGVDVKEINNQKYFNFVPSKYLELRNLET